MIIPLLPAVLLLIAILILVVALVVKKPWRS